MAAGRFREDLHYRLNCLTLTLLRLRERSDLPATAVALLDDGEDAVTLAQLDDALRVTLDSNARPASRPAAAPGAGGDLRELADARIRETPAAVEGNGSEAARRLGVSRNTL